MISNSQRQKGFSLVELMIGLFVALLVAIPATVYVTRISNQAGMGRELESTQTARELVVQKLTASSDSAGRHLTLLLDDPSNSTTYADEVTADSPRVWYRFDDSRLAGTIVDRTGNGYDAAVTGSPTYAEPSALASDPNASMSFTGRASGSALGLDFGTPTSDYSVEWWLKPTALTDYSQFISSNRAGAYGTWGFLVMSSGSLYCGPNSATAISPADVPGGTVRAGEWQHFVYTYEGGRGSIYRNGALLASKVQDPAAGWDAISIHNVNGGIDELAVYFRALSAERVRAHYIAAVAPPVPQDTVGFRVPQLPLVKWPSGSFTRPSGPVMVGPSEDKILFLSADDTFSPTQTRAAFTAGSGTQTLTTRAGSRAAPASGDFLLVIDYEAGLSSLVKVTGQAAETASAYLPLQVDWAIPVEPVSTTDPAWGMVASDDADLSSQLRAGSTVVRLSPPVGYQLKGGRLVRTVGLAEQTLATAAASFTARRVTGTPNQSWTVTYRVEGEAFEASSDDNWKQKEAASLTITPPALNPPPALTRN